MYQCGACGGTHFGRFPVQLKTGKRLARCGKVVYLVIARTYRGTGPSRRRMTPAQWRLSRQVPDLLRAEQGMTERALAARLTSAARPCTPS